MTKPLLSILIPTVVGREEQFSRLIASILGQHKMNGNYPNNELGIIHLRDNKEITIGEKRERLYQMATGLYSLQVDDDDDLAPNAIKLILNAIKENPNIPCITFREKCMMNGEYKSSNHSLKYSQWMDNQDGYDYVRSPFYKDVIRTDIAKSVPFPHIRYNEDEQWAKALYPLLTDEIHIEEELYYYIYEPKDSHEIRYGINKG